MTRRYLWKKMMDLYCEAPFQEGIDDLLWSIVCKLWVPEGS